MYQYSLEQFQNFFFKAIASTPAEEDEEKRGKDLRQNIRETIYKWVSRGLFERHKQIFQGQLVFRLMAKKIVDVNYTSQHMDFLINATPKVDPLNPNPCKKWLPTEAWGAVLRLTEIEEFSNIANAVGKEASKRFEDWYNENDPENVALPGDYRGLEQEYFKKLLVLRCLRPDRMTTALTKFFGTVLPNGTAFTECDAGLGQVAILESAYEDATPTIPIYFVLSPGANPIKDVEELCKKKGINTKTSFHLVALGQGQEQNAYNKLEMGHKEGHWVMLQNVHLMPEFLVKLEEKLAGYAAVGSHQTFRLFLTSDPSAAIPIGLLESCIKLTCEPPAGMKANLLRAINFFEPKEFDEQDNKERTIRFALCYFHAVMIERKKFGAKGWNANYNFSIGDLRDSSLVAHNYLERANQSTGKVPWDDLRYIFGDIMYGGYITDDEDRLLCSTYLANIMTEGLWDDPELFLFSDGKNNNSFKSQNALQHDKYVEYIRDFLPPETPLAFGMHPNTEIDFRTQQCKALFAQLVELAPKDAVNIDDNAPTPLSRFVDFEERVSTEFSLESNKPLIEDIRSKFGEETKEMLPYQTVFLQECETMGILIDIVCKSCAEIVLANKGELTMSESMENLMNDIFMNKVPASWMKFSFESTRGLASWLESLNARLQQLNTWKDDVSKLPRVTWLNRLKNPSSFLTAVQQVYARKHMYELNKLYVKTDILKKMYWDDLPEIKEIDKGAYIFGMQIDGCKWDMGAGNLDESDPKKQFSLLPVVQVRAEEIGKLKRNDPTTFMCAVYLTPLRGKSIVPGFKAQLRTKAHPDKWILAGVSIILDVEGFSDPYKPGFNPNAEVKQA